MRKYQKTAISALSCMALLLASVPAASANETSMPVMPSQDGQILHEQELSIYAQNFIVEYFDGGYSTDIYLSGNVTFTFLPRTTGEYVFNVEDMSGNLKGSGRVIASDLRTKTITLGNLKGYHKIVAYSPNGGGGDYQIRF
ncbi:hypothetical protein M3629_26620 [Paenibacillus polysaccharolyticus]|uniref:hypothetical protein n=1 Tax=Paenibacillus polysaccharolyticus TaxID=582692 RepID=UPI002040E6D4|nr:hypothetical protein [Paenibacillus polysaccharolyticus]MCM3136352.1 hypothetical protein [Paenibacillus polysaccharolyticus]